jgi:hypothetical protein
MRLLILNLVRVADLLVALGLLVVFSAGIYSLWLDFLHRPFLLVDLATLVICSLLIWWAGKGILYLIQRKLDFAAPYEYWQAETALYSNQWGSAVINPCLSWMIHILCALCFLPIFYKILPGIIFWILLGILVSISLFCLSQFRFGLIQRQIHTHYLPRTQAFIDFYLASMQGEWSDNMDSLFAKIDSSSTDFLVAKQIRAQIKHEPREAVTIRYDYIDIGYGPGFEATPENVAAHREASFDSFDAGLKTPEHLG